MDVDWLLAQPDFDRMSKGIAALVELGAWDLVEHHLDGFFRELDGHLVDRPVAWAAAPRANAQTGRDPRS